jgi:GH15 family glucan-1,4-alpha-glucosidase
MSSRIEDYALIGDCETAALVAKDGSIDWLCWPRFDSGACFSALLGDASHGRWRVAPVAATGAGANMQVRRRYWRNTLILETEFATSDGGSAVGVIDFMPLRQGRTSSHLVRLVVGKRGAVPMRVELIVRFGYGGWVPWVTRSEAGDLLAIAGPDMLVLRTPVELRGEDLTTVGDFVVSAGQRVPFVLTYAPSHLPPPEPIDVDDALRSTEEFWQSWTGAWRPPNSILRSFCAR